MAEDNQIGQTLSKNPERELSMTTVFRDDLIRIQILRRKHGDDNSQECISRALDQLENILMTSSVEASR